MRLNQFIAIGAILLFGGALALVAKFFVWQPFQVIAAVLFTLSVATGFCLVVESKVTPTLGYLFGTILVAAPVTAAVFFGAAAGHVALVAITAGSCVVIGAVMVVRGFMALHDFWGLTDLTEDAFDSY